MNSQNQKVIALILAVIFMFSSSPGIYAAENTAQYVPEAALQIGTVEELQEFSKNCENESYSQNLHVTITQDIDLSGHDFSSIPIFCGTLDGRGHTISGLSIYTKGSNKGLFRYLTESAKVENLHINGTVEPDGTQSNVGILAGENSGTIINCVTSGSVSGDKRIGGIVGENKETGTISDSRNEAEVAGKTDTGGIAGLNEGAITGCISSGGINLHNNNSYTNTGGIAGYSSGWIESCVNRGEVGYEHNGYNSGGIAGFHSGIIIDCQNHGTIWGRKDLGGIAGQFEPSIDKLEHEGKLDKLDREMDTLSNLFREFSDTLEANIDDTRDNARELKDVMRETQDIIKSARDEASRDLDRTRDSIDSRKRRLEGEMDDLADHIDALGSSVYRNIQKVLDAIKELRRALEEAKKNADDSLLETIARIEYHLDCIETELETIRSIIRGILEQIRGNRIALGSSAAPTQFDESDNITDTISSAMEQIRQAVANSMEHVAAIVQEVAAAAEELAEACGKTPGYFRDLADTLSAAADNLSREIGYSGSGAADNLEKIKSQLSKISDIASDQGSSSRNRLKDTADSLGEQIDAVQNQADFIADGVLDHTDALGGVSDRIIDQLDNIRDIVVNSEKQEFTIDDISGDWDGSVLNGSIISSINTGDVTGDYHVGGIAGMIAHEMFEDPEVDWELSDAVMGNVTALVRATIRDADNSGTITAKNDYAGGIVGRADVGAVIGTVNTGNVETTDGDYCGGIAGASNHMILRSHSMSVLTGNDKVGGIVGKGRDIQGCYAMTTIHSGGENLGAIAGKVGDENETEEDSLLERLSTTSTNLFQSDKQDDELEISGNFFLEEDTAGIDGINYQGKAEPLSYEEFTALEELPDSFLHFGITFVAEGKVVRTFPLSYGEAFDPSLTPPCPTKDGQVGYWQEFDASSIRRNVVVEAEYEPWVTSISTREAQPTMLVEGFFSNSAVVQVDQYNFENIVIPGGYVPMKAYSFVVIENGTPATGDMTIRVQADGGGKAKILWIEENAEHSFLDCVQDGSYLVWTAPGNGSFIILTEQRGFITVFTIAGLVLVLVFMIKWRNKKRNNKNKSPNLEKAVLKN